MTIESLRHDTTSRELVLDDAFTRWAHSLPPKHWARYDISACALGWNAAIDAALGQLRRKAE